MSAKSVTLGQSNVEQAPEIWPDHWINWGRLIKTNIYKADCTCGWGCEGDRETVKAAITKHEETF